MIDEKYPISGFFTNNTNDTRAIEFFNIYFNNDEDTYSDNKILKKEYAQLFIDGFNFLKNLLNILNKNDLNNVIINKWQFDFFSNFIDFKKYKLENLFINYEDNYDDVINTVKLVFSNYNDLIKINSYSKENKIKVLQKFISQIKEYLIKFLINNYLFFYDENNIKTNINEILNKKNKKNKKIFFNKNNSNYLILDINEYLNKKYALYFKILRNNNEMDIKFDLNYKTISNIDLCSGIFLNIKNNKCDILYKVINEKYYGQYSKEFFENDENFKIFNEFNINHFNMHTIILLLNKLEFKIKIIYIENLYNDLDSYFVRNFNSDPKNIQYFKENSTIPKYIKYYEKFENWQVRQNISKKLNNQPNLKLYLNKCIDIINRRITYLNPYFNDFTNLTNLIFRKKNTLKDQYKKLINLINKYQNIELKEILKTLDQQNKFLNNLIPENYNLINNNYLNNISLIKTLINKPSKNNSYLIANILNSSYEFQKSLFEF